MYTLQPAHNSTRRRKRHPKRRPTHLQRPTRSLCPFPADECEALATGTSLATVATYGSNDIVNVVCAAVTDLSTVTNIVISCVATVPATVCTLSADRVRGSAILGVVWRLAIIFLAECMVRGCWCGSGYSRTLRLLLLFTNSRHICTETATFAFAHSRKQ